MEFRFVRYVELDLDKEEEEYLLEMYFLFSKKYGTELEKDRNIC